jgi:2-polyprenyl-6-methoxyphenol hydroxylase-like FAD-dependent oxidoreductase
MPDSSFDKSPNTPHEKPNRVACVAIVGTGLVGATTAYALLISGTVAEIVLIDKDKRRAKVTRMI